MTTRTSADNGDAVNAAFDEVYLRLRHAVGTVHDRHHFFALASQATAVSGAQVYQHRIGTTNSTFSASPAAGPGHLYLASEDGEVFAVKAGPAYELVSTNRMGEPLMATPVISDGVIFIRGQQHLRGEVKPAHLPGCGITVP
jgi:hypothetical protein